MSLERTSSFFWESPVAFSEPAEPSVIVWKLLMNHERPVHSKYLFCSWIVASNDALCKALRVPNKFAYSPSTWSFVTTKCKSKCSTYTNSLFQLSSQIEISICKQFESRWKESRSHCHDYWSWSISSWSYCRCHSWLNLGAAPFLDKLQRK